MASSNLPWYAYDGLRERRRGGEDGPEEDRCGDKGDVHDQQAERRHTGFCKRAGREEPGVGAFHEMDARVVAKFHCDLAEAGIDGCDVRGTVLEEAVREASGGCTDVEAGAAGDVDVPAIEGRLELEAAAAHVRHVVAEDPHRSVGANRGARLVDFLLVHEDTPGKDESAGTLATGREVTFNEEQIDAGFRGDGQGLVLVLRIRRDPRCPPREPILGLRHMTCNRLAACPPCIPVCVAKYSDSGGWEESVSPNYWQHSFSCTKLILQDLAVRSNQAFRVHPLLSPTSIMRQKAIITCKVPARIVRLESVA